LEISFELYFFSPSWPYKIILSKKKFKKSLPSFASGHNFFEILKKIQVPGILELSPQLPSCPKQPIPFLLVVLKYGRQYTKLLQMDTSLQDDSLQP